MNLSDNLFEYFKKPHKDKSTYPETCKICDMLDCKCREEKIVEIKLIDSVSFQSNITKEKLKEYLKGIMLVDDLGDCLFVKKIFKYATFKIEFTSGSNTANIIYVSQIKDDENNTINKELFY